MTLSMKLKAFIFKPVAYLLAVITLLNIIPVAKAEEVNTFELWTDYSQYAQPNENGFAYYIVDDPDVSSEIMPIDGKQDSRVLLFTFDDAPAGFSLEIAQKLKELDVNAIFLINGKLIETEADREVIRAVYDLGFEIGNHTFSHSNLRELTYEEQYEEIESVNQLILSITGTPARWFRPPFGLFNMDTIEICNELGLQLMTWSFGYDWMEEYQEGELLTEVSLDNQYIRPGANILMHDLPWTAEAIEGMVKGYREMGYHIVDPYLILAQENSTEPLSD